MSLSNPRRRTPAQSSGHDDVLTIKTTMTLRKGATFHSPTSPIASPTDSFIPPPIRRSQSNLDDVVDAHRRRVALTLDTIDKSLASTQDVLSSPKKRALRDTSLPVPPGLLDLPIVDPAMAKDDAERRVLRPRNRRSGRNHDGDSGLGTSIESSRQDKESTATKKASRASAITRSAAASPSATENVTGLGARAVSRIHEHILRPLRAKPSLRDFEPIIVDIPRKIQEKEIICLRDLEKTLILLAPAKTKTAELYLDFCLTSIRCIQATVQTLSPREQTRPSDRPYTNGYFIDLVEQIHQYASQLAAAKENGADAMDVDPTDELKLFGGLHENGRPAELIRVRKDGTAVSMATGEEIDLDEDAKPVKMKRSLSQQLEDEEEIMRSMARRKKNASPDEYAPKQCREPGCNKEFKRPCDLTKHEKTHSRPWKCPVPTCKYHEYGWPTEKEMDRHHNDKHSSNPAMYECLFKPCPYKSKRESNCKQHMEKAHNWSYVRTKTNGKKTDSKPGSVQHPTPHMGTMPTPSSMATPPEESAMRFASNINAIEFPPLMSDEDFRTNFGQQPPMVLDDFATLGPHTPSTESSYGYSTFQEGPEFTLNDQDLYTVHLPTPDQSNFGKLLAELQLQPTTVAPAQPAAHISPIGQGNAMLYTPNSLVDYDEGFDEFPVDCGTVGGDFQLFPSGNQPQVKGLDSLFADVPSAGLGFSQTASQDLFPTSSQMDWFASQNFHDQH